MDLSTARRADAGRAPVGRPAPPRAGGRGAAAARRAATARAPEVGRAAGGGDEDRCRRPRFGLQNRGFLATVRKTLTPMGV
jgi:hypothetical protein